MTNEITFTTAELRQLATPGMRPLPERDPVLAYFNSLTSENSRDGMTKALRSAIRIIMERPITTTESGRTIVGVTTDEIHEFPWDQLTPAHAAAIRASIAASGLSTASKNKMINGIRGVIKSAWRLELIDGERSERVRDVLKTIRTVSDEPSGRYVEWGERKALFIACGRDETPRGARDAATLALLCIGLRRSEVCSLNMSDFDPATGRLAIRQSKGGRTRNIYVDNGALQAMKLWLSVRGDERGALILPVTRSGTTVLHTKKPRGSTTKKPARMTDNAIYAILSRRIDEAGINPFTPHDLRRTVISDLLDSGVDLPTVQAHAGHANPMTTARYDRRGDRAKRKAAGTIEVPFVG